MRLIDADALKETLGMKDDCADCDKELRGKSKACEFDRAYTKMDFCGWIDDAPTVHPEPPKRGKWVEDVAYYDEDGCPCIITRCDQCGEPNPVSKFCPNCGAKMEGNDGND